MALWLPLDDPEVRVRRNVAPVTGGTFIDLGAPLVIQHTTEGDRFTPNPRLYHGHTGWPHITIDRDGTIFQHIDLDLAARALKNLPGGVQTNRRRWTWQVENVGRSPSVPGQVTLTDAQVRAGRWFVAFLHRHRGLPLRADPPWVIPGSARVDAPQRMSAAEWYAAAGVSAHARAPENDHWDVGGIPLSAFLPTIPPLEEDPMKLWNVAGDIYLASGVHAVHIMQRDDQTIETVAKAYGVKVEPWPGNPDSFVDSHVISAGGGNPRPRQSTVTH